MDNFLLWLGGAFFGIGVGFTIYPHIYNTHAQLLAGGGSGGGYIELQPIYPPPPPPLTVYRPSQPEGSI